MCSQSWSFWITEKVAAGTVGSALYVFLRSQASYKQYSAINVSGVYLRNDAFNKTFIFINFSLSNVVNALSANNKINGSERNKFVIFL